MTNLLPCPFPLEVETERYKYINERATAFLGYPILEEVVRCRDCRFHCHVIADDYCMRPDGNGDYMRTEVEPDGFCKWGEPK